MNRGELSLYPDLAIVMAENGYTYNEYVAAANDDDWECMFITPKEKYAKLIEHFTPEE